MSGEGREHVTGGSKHASRRLPLGDGLACEPPMSPVPIPLAFGRAAPARAAVHPATGLAGDLWRAAPVRATVHSATPLAGDFGRAAWRAGMRSSL
jgi:hypothetical protein